jgi:hypothetical protein
MPFIVIELRARFRTITFMEASMARRAKHSSKESDALRLDDLAEQHGLTFKHVGMIYRFQDFTAYGLDQALGYAEGYDRAVAAVMEKSSDVAPGSSPELPALVERAGGDA